MKSSIDPHQAWRGPFESWKAAVAGAAGDGESWSGDEWMRRQKKFLDEARAESELPPRPSSLPIVAGSLNTHRIVDYGGGSGWAFELLRKSCPALSISSYTVLELPEVVATLRRSQMIDQRLNYLPFDEFRSATGADLLYSNASLHYAESEQQFHSTAIALGPVPWLLFDGFLAHPEREFFMLQRVYGREVPVRVPQLDRSLQDLSDLGFRVTSCTPMLGPVGGDYMYGLPLQSLGELYLETRRYCITAVWNGVS